MVEKLDAQVSGEGKGFLSENWDRLGTMVSPIANFWDKNNQKHEEKRFGAPFIGLFQDQRTKPRKGRSFRNWGPGGAVGFGCGAGIGVALTGGAGIGVAPWNGVKLVLGLGVGCGVGLGYGFGQGIGVRWDQPPKKRTSSKKVVIEI